MVIISHYRYLERQADAVIRVCETMMSDLQQNSSCHPPIASTCSSNGGFDNNVSLHNSTNSCFPPSSSSATSSTYPWGTWEDLLLASAVLRHGTDNWTTVSCELQARAFLVPPSIFSAEACKVRFWILNGRFSSCSNGAIRDGKIPWFEEVRKLRVAQLKRELERYDGSIGLLEKKLNRLKAESAESKAVVSRIAHEQDSPSSLVPEEMVCCLQVCSASDGMPAEQSLRTSSRCLLESEFVPTSCTASTGLKGGAEVQESISVSDLKESLTVVNANQSLSSSGLVFDGSLKNTVDDMQLGSILDQNALVCACVDKINGQSTIEVDHRPHNSQDRSCNMLEDTRSYEKIEGAELESNVALSLSMEDQRQESQAMFVGSEDDGASALGGGKKGCNGGINKLEDGRLALEDAHGLCSPLGLGRLVENYAVCTAVELEDPPWLSRLVNDAGCAKSVECINVLPTSAGKPADNVVKEVYAVEDSLVSASAMDLLRIAYADGTPVSTPEAVEIHPVEPDKTEESEESEKADRLCRPLFHPLEPDLLCCNVVDVPCLELQSTEQNQTKVLSVEVATPVQIELPNAASALGLEHSSEQRGCQVAEISSSLSKAPIISNLEVETIVEKTAIEEGQNGESSSIVLDRTCSVKLEPDKKFLSNEPQEGSIAHETQTWKGAGSDSLECSKSYGKGCSANAKAGPCAEVDKEKSEEIAGVAIAKDYIQEVKCEAACSVDVENMATICPKIHVVGLKEEFSSSTIQCEKETMELAQAVNQRCDQNPVHGIIYYDNHDLDIVICHSDGSKSVMDASNRLVNEQEEPNSDCAMPDSPLAAVEGTLKANRPTVQRLNSDVKADSMTSKKQAKLEERSKPLVGCKSYRDAGSSSPPFRGRHGADIDALEEDGLLVDLMKLKDTDLTTLRKRKHLSRGGNHVEKRKDYGLDDFFVNKHPKVTRCREEDVNRTLLSATQNKSPSKIKNLQSSSGDISDQAKNTSNVSLSDSHLMFGSKESAVEVFSTRRSRLKLRKLDSPREEPDKTKRQIGGSVQKFEAVVSNVADKEVSELEISGLLPMVNNVKTIADNGFPPDLLILLECLRSISGHRFAPLFKIRPEIQSDARYRGLVKRHMDLITVRTKLEEGKYTESLEFFRDMMLIFSNALVFYSRDSQEYGAARALRESLMREMDRYLREESPQRSSAVTQADKYSETKVFKILNNSCSVTTCEGKRQASAKSSCYPTVCDSGCDGHHGAIEATLVSRTAAQDNVLGNRNLVKESVLKKKDHGDLAAGKAFSKTNMARTKARGVEVDRLNTERLDNSRSLEDVFPDLSTKRNSVTSGQVLRRSHQASLRTPREYTPRKDSSDKSRNSKYSFERPGSLSQGRQGEPRETLGGGRSSRSAQQSKQTHTRGIQSYSQPQKRART